MGMSRGGGEDMMLFEENFVFEQNEDHTLVTNLYNYTLPLIRYRMNDRLIPAEKPATDRHPYRRVKEIVGRAEGGDLVFRRPDGREERITSFAFGSLSWKHVERIQFHVGNDTCRLDLVPEPGLGASRRRGGGERCGSKLRDLFASRSLHHVGSRSAPSTSIEPDPATGKVRAVVTISRPVGRTRDAAALAPARTAGPPRVQSKHKKHFSPNPRNRSEKPAASVCLQSRCRR